MLARKLMPLCDFPRHPPLRHLLMGTAAASFVILFGDTLVTHSSTFPPENIFTACWALVSQPPPPPAPASQSSGGKTAPQNRCPFGPGGTPRYTLKGRVEQESWITTLWRWSSYATCSSHPYKERRRLTSANPQRHFAARLSTTLRMPFLLFFFCSFFFFFCFRWNNALCWMHSRAGLIPAGALAAARVT